MSQIQGAPSDDEIPPCKFSLLMPGGDLGCGRRFPRRDFADVSSKGIGASDISYYGICVDCFFGGGAAVNERPT
eukprot:8180208-Pyramimonas_sp.AAC.1